MNPIRKILVGIDFSERCWAALERGRRLADLWDASLVVVHILQDLPYEGATQGSELVGLMGKLEEQIAQDMAQKVQKQVGSY